MNSIERVYAAIRHQPVDRLPRFSWIGRGAGDNLRKALGSQADDIDELIGNDVKQTWLSINGEMDRPCEEGESFVDEWGIRWHRDGYYNAVISHPLADLEEEEILAYPFPDPDKPERYEYLQELIDKYGKEKFIGADVSGSMFEPAFHLRGMDNLMVDMATEDPVADIILDRLCDFTTKVACRATRMGVNWIWLGDDMGSQQSMLISPDMWRKYFKPRMKKIIDAVHEIDPDMPIAYHSCGSIYPIIGELAEIGINVLNPLQESAKGMDHAKIVEEFGDKLTFMCGLDTQTFLRHASPEEVKQTMLEKCKILSAKGGYIVSACHTIQQDVPVENILAMIEALDLYQA